MPFTTNGKVRIHWEETGSGDPLLLVMGANFPATMWFRQLPALAEHYRVITFDNRGAGETVEGTEPWTIDDMAADAMAVLDAAGVDRAHVYGASLGGGISQVIALNYPDRVGALILGCTAPKAGKPKIPYLALAAKVLPKLFAGDKAKYTAYAEVMLYAKSTPKKLVVEDIEMYMSTPGFDTSRSKGQQAALQAFPGTQDKLHTITAPTMVIHGDKDPVVAYEHGQLIARTIPGAKLVTVPGASHMYNTDNLELSNSSVLGFLGEHALADLSR